MASSRASSSNSINKDIKSRQSDNVIIYIQSGGSLQTINGVTKYFPLESPKRLLPLLSPVTHSGLVMRVAEKLRLNTSFKLFYKNPLNGEIFELGDDDDMLMFENVCQIISQTLTLFVVNSDNDDDGGDDDDNQPDIDKYIPLDRAIMSGDWETAKAIFEKEKDALTAGIDFDGNTALHIAIGTPHFHFVKKILEMIDDTLLPEIVSKKKWTALHSAAFFGNLEAAEMLLDRSGNKHLLFMVDIKGELPIFDYLEKLIKLLSIFTNKLSTICLKNPKQTLVFVNRGGDAAYELIQRFPDMATTQYEKQSPLNCIATMRDAYFSGTQYNFYQRFIYSNISKEKSGIAHANPIQIEEKYMIKCWRRYFYPGIQKIHAKTWEFARQHVPHIKKISKDREKHKDAVLLLKYICIKVFDLTVPYDQKLEHFRDGFNLAAKNDISEAIEAIIHYFPQATWIMSKEGYKLSQNAVINRSEKVYNFLVEKVVNNHVLKTCMYEGNNNLLHLVAKRAPIHKPNKVIGAALQMQRELQWFKEVETFVFPKDKEQPNEEGDIPMMVFRKSHEGLRKDGEEWMKKTADSYTITAALIITIAFAAAITVPGGNNGDTGKAIFERHASFILFVVSDAISMFTSSTSLLLFLSVLTARYQEEDFLHSLPTRLILGLVMLFLSVTSMIVAFSATLYLLFGRENSWILIPIGVLTCLPIASFVTLQFPLLVELILSTYGRGIFPKKGNSQRIKLHHHRE